MTFFLSHDSIEYSNWLIWFKMKRQDVWIVNIIHVYIWREIFTIVSPKIKSIHLFFSCKCTISIMIFKIYIDIYPTTILFTLEYKSKDTFYIMF